jgi:hypothetical protein
VSHARMKSDHGVVMIIGALIMTALLISVAFAVDLGNARQFKRQAQATADAAALAGAGSLDGSDNAALRTAAVEQVKLYAHRNFDVDPISWNGCGDTVPTGWVAPDAGNGNYCILVDDANVRVRITELPRRPVASFFGQLAGVDEIEITASAAAITQTGVTAPCGLCVLGPFNTQNGDITVSGDAGVAIDGNAEAGPNGGLDVLPPGGITLYRDGVVTRRPQNFSPAPTSTSGPLPDPLAGVPVPPTAGPVKTGCNQGPGVYASLPQGCTLSPGLYVITGGTNIASSFVDGTAGVTFYLTCGGTGGARPCNSGESGAQVVCPGNSTFDAVAQPVGQPSVGGAIPGMAVFFDRNNTGRFDCRGNGGSGLVGTLYGRSATLTMRGNGECTFDRSLVVMGALSFNGNPSNCRVHYDSSENFQLQGMSALIE